MLGDEQTLAQPRLHLLNSDTSRTELVPDSFRVSAATMAKGSQIEGAQASH